MEVGRSVVVDVAVAADVVDVVDVDIGRCWGRCVDGASKGQSSIEVPIDKLLMMMWN